MITPELILELQTPAGGWTRESLGKLGIGWPPPKGWKRRLETEYYNKTLMSDTVETHPVQTPYHAHEQSQVPKVVAMRAYEVYCKVNSPQAAMVTGNCRGGFSTGELIAMLYAHTFPESEWRARLGEAFKGMEHL